MKPEIRDRTFIGTGWAFPLQFSPRGRIALATGEHDIEQAIQIILGTVPGERVMRPEFGCRAWELIFAPRNPATEGLLVAYVQEALGRWEPRIEVLEVGISHDPLNDGALIADIKYQVKATHDERSIVYPFFITSEGEA